MLFIILEIKGDFHNHKSHVIVIAILSKPLIIIECFSLSRHSGETNTIYIEQVVR